MTPEEKAKAREWINGLIEQAIEDDGFEVHSERETEVIPIEEYLRDGRPIPAAIERRFTGKRTLSITWWAKP